MPSKKQVHWKGKVGLPPKPERASEGGGVARTRLALSREERDPVDKADSAKESEILVY